MTTDTNLSQIVFNRLSNEKYHELKTSGQLNDQQFYITPDLDTNPGLIQDYMSNCITKIPQHINLELSTDGTLTLKAGSVVYIPNGVGVFDEVTVNSDISVTEVWNRNGINMLFYNPSNKINSIGIAYTNSDIWSGSNPVINKQYGFWYDTTNNLIRYTTDTGTSWISGFSLPICIVTSDNEIISSIDQVFNGIGYIGAVAFALPGVQAIIPNGFNKDSQLNNYTATVERVLLKDYAADGLLGSNLALTLTNSPLLSAGNMIYVEEENQIYKNFTTELDKRTEVEIAKVTTDSTRITSLTPLPVYNRILNSAQVYDFGNDLLEKNITNCITKIPQDIKLELSTDGTLTLKAGSKVYDGTGNVVNIDKDSSVTFTENYKLMVFAWLDTKSISIRVLEQCFSGATQPNSSYYHWYDTTNKTVKSYGLNNAFEGNCSLPIAVISASGGKISSIDQIFNGMGYIGSITFALPGIEGLIPNRRNTDGSLNNTKFTTNSVLTRINPNKYAAAFVMTLRNDNLLEIGTAAYGYDEDKNINYNTINNEPFEFINAGTYSTDSTGRITSFNPKTTFQAVDRNDYYSLEGIDKNIDFIVESGTTNGITWEKWKSGKLIQSGSMNVTITSRVTTVPVITFPKPMSDTNYKVFTGTTYNSAISNVSYNITSSLQTSGINGGGHSGNICAVDNTAMSSGTVKIWWKVEGQGA